MKLDLARLPTQHPGCASRGRDPDVEAELRARRARREGRIRSRSLWVGGHEDPQETLYRRGMTDGLPVVPPTPERVVAMLDHTSRHPQDVIGILPPYDRPATVEKVAINAVMAGCPGPALPIVLAAVDAVCEESFSLQGVIATTNPVGPLLIVSGPLAAKVRMNSGGNCMGQGNRANLGIGRAGGDQDRHRPTGSQRAGEVGRVHRSRRSSDANLEPTELLRPENPLERLRATIQTGHKLARRAIAEAETITKYGAPIGVATLPIKPGEHVHIHNIRSNYTTSYSLAEAKAAFASARGGS